VTLLPFTVGCRLIEELTLAYHTARQQAITEEMLELAVSAGLIRGQQSARWL